MFIKDFSPANATFFTMVRFVVFSGQMFADWAKIFREFGVAINAKLGSFTKLKKN